MNNSTNDDYNVMLVETLDAGVTYLSADHTWNAEAQARVGAIDPQPSVEGQQVTFDVGTAIAGSGPLLSFEGGRVVYRVKVADGLASLGWEINEDQRDAVRKVLPPQFGVNGLGQVSKR